MNEFEGKTPSTPAHAPGKAGDREGLDTGTTTDPRDRYYGKDGAVWKSPIETLNGNGSTTISIGFPVCEMSDVVGPEAASTVADLMNAGVAALAPSPTGNEAPRGEGAEAHDGWLFHNPDTGTEWSNSHPVESGEVPDAESIRPATLQAFREEMLAAWEMLEDARQERDRALAIAAAPPLPVSSEPEEIVPAMGYGTTAAQQEAFRREHFPNVSTEPDSRAGAEISDAAVAKAMDEDGGWWKSCSGCHETSEGQETGHYPYSELFRCHVGGGCIECGGLGVRWEYYSEEQYAEMEAALHPSPPTASGAAAPVGERYLKGHLDDRYRRGNRPNTSEPASSLPSVADGHTVAVKTCLATPTPAPHPVPAGQTTGEV